MHMLAELSLEPEHRRGHGALYGTVNCGRVDIARLRWALHRRVVTAEQTCASMLLPDERHRTHETGRSGSATIAEAHSADGAVAVEPVPVRLSARAETTWPVSVERSRQPRWKLIRRTRESKLLAMYTANKVKTRSMPGTTSSATPCVAASSVSAMTMAIGWLG